MKVSAFDFDLPPERIALRPADPRDSSRLLVVGDRVNEDRVFRDLPGLLRPGDLLAFNDTKVIPARLFGRRGDVKIEATLHKRQGAGRWSAFARPAKRLKPGDEVDFGLLKAVVASKSDGGEVALDFRLSDAALMAGLAKTGVMPLPPYIAGKRAVDEQDLTDYQTLFAAREGAVAAPTAGLHFTPRVLDGLAQRGVETLSITLHVGAGTFLPIKAEDTEDHRMHAELGEIGEDAARKINAAKDSGRRIVAVGTTVLRLLESAATSGKIEPFLGETDIFITPGFPFRCVDLLITNFHLPRSTLFMLVSAFAGLDRMKTAYRDAIRRDYRFYSYGDACLLSRREDTA